MNKLAIIDIDSMFYMSTGKPSFEECINSFREKFQNLLDKTECTHYAAFTSKGKTFRHQIANSYKANRTQAPKYLQAIKEWAIEEYDINVCSGYEADDAVKYWYFNPIYFHPEECNFDTNNMFLGEIDNNAKLIEKIICSPDKDLIKSIASKNFNYSYKLEDKNDPNSLVKGWWIETSKEDAYTNFWVSMIKGDSVDNIKGLPGKAEGFIKKEYGDLSILNDNMVYYQYSKHYGQSQGIYEFQKNYRLLHILENNEDFMREVGELPPFPKIIEVKVNNNEIKCEF